MSKPIQRGSMPAHREGIREGLRPPDDREQLSRVPNPVGMEGIEFIEYTTSRAQALGQVLEMVGFRPIARHRSREVLLYRQGSMNIIINAHPDDQVPLTGAPVIAAFALRVRDARSAYQYVVDRGAWPVPVRTEVMELHIPAVRCAGGSRIYFIDRYRDFSIYDVDFVPYPTVDQHPPALAGMDFFGIVQYIGPERAVDWIEFYRELFAFVPIPDEVRFGILPRGTLLRSPCGTFYLQLVEADWDAADSGPGETLRRIGFGTPDVMGGMAALAARGITFIDNESVHPSDRGAVTQAVLGGVMFELVHRDAGKVVEQTRLGAGHGS